MSHRRDFLIKSTSASLGFAFPATVAPVSLACHPILTESEPKLPCHILLSGGLDAKFEQEISNIDPGIQLIQGSDRNRFQEMLPSANVVFGNVSKSDFARAKNLKWVQTISAGVENQVFPEFVESPVLLTNAKGCYGPAIAEHVFGLLFSLTRRIASQVRHMKDHQWGESGESMELRNFKIGIVGFGGIGRQIARRAKAMDMEVLGADIQGFYTDQLGNLCDQLFHVDGGGLEQLLEASDVVVSAVPHTPRSEGMFNEARFARMKKGSYFINISRGKVVKTDALMKALTSGHLAGAGLDVTDPEPLPKSHALWDMDNVIVTSHISGRSQYSWDRAQSVFTENVKRFITGREMVNLVDKRAGF